MIKYIKNILFFMVPCIGIIKIASVTFFNPYLDHDSVIYAIIGKAILKGNMPYHFAFDHKPIFIYYYYSLMHIVYPFKYGIFVISSLISILVFSIFTCKISNQKLIYAPLISLLIIIFTYSFIHLSGNTEFVFTTLSISSVYFLIKKTQKKIIISAALAAAAFNTNYLSCIGLAPSLVFLLITGDTVKSRVVDFFNYAIFFSLSCVLLILPIAVDGGINSIILYFSEQYSFLSLYGEKSNGSLFYFIKLGIVYSGIIFATIYYWDHAKDKRTITGIFIFTLFSFIGCLTPGNQYDHYIYPFIAGIVCLASISFNESRYIVIAGIMSPFFLNTVSTIEALQKDIVNKNREFIWANSEKIKYITNSAPVLSVKSGHIPFYFGNLNASQKYIWASHTKLIFGDKEKDYFYSEILKRPPFILSKEDICSSSWTNSSFCSYLKENYKYIFSTYTGENVSLYALR